MTVGALGLATRHSQHRNVHTSAHDPADSATYALVCHRLATQSPTLARLRVGTGWINAAVPAVCLVAVGLIDSQRKDDTL